MFAQTFIEMQYDFPLTPPDTIVDAGANIGAASLFFASRFPNARIIALEPDPSNYEALVRNVAGFPSIIPMHAALWSYRGRLVLQTTGLAKSETQVIEAGATGKGDVECLSVADLLSQFGVGSIDLLKMDVEGSEKEILDQSASWIENIGTLVVELHERLTPGTTASFESATKDFDEHFTSGENRVATRKRVPR